MKTLIKSTLILLSIFSLGANLAHGNDQDALKDVLSNKYREDNSKRDQFRHPLETLTFFQVKEDQTIIEILPGSGGWYTSILAPLTRDHGSFTAAQYDPASKSSYVQRTVKKFNAKLTANPELFDKVKIGIFQMPSKFELGEAGSADRVLTFRNLHNWVGKDNAAEVKAIFESFYTVLKVGGKLGLTDHRLPEDRTNPTDGYLKQSYAIKMAESVGFVLEASSEINANAKDSADHPKGVWTLPPSYALKDVDRAKYEAIGESDRMTLLFVKK